MTLLRVDFHIRSGAIPQPRLPETELALRNPGSKFVTPWQVEQYVDL
jgi:hypothetical protein